MATRKKVRPSRPSRPKTRGTKPARSARPARPKRPKSVSPAAAAADSPDRRRNPETLRLRAITPSLTVADVKRSVAFYTDVLGFIVSEYWTEDGEQPQGAMLKAGACELGLSQDDGRKGIDRKKGEGVRMWCQTVQDIDALATRIKAAGVTLSEEPSDRWGDRSLSLDDPDGYHLSIAKRG